VTALSVRARPAPEVVGCLPFRDQRAFPEVDLSQVQLDPATLVIGLLR
jgi:hypothetical protein